MCHIGGGNYYEIVAPDQAELHALVPTSGELPQMRRYMPLAEETKLFRILADLGLNRESVRAFVPPRLTAAVWLQFAQAVDGDKGYRSCQEVQALV